MKELPITKQLRKQAVADTVAFLATQPGVKVPHNDFLNLVKAIYKFYLNGK
jgi:hypothetical protein